MVGPWYNFRSGVTVVDVSQRSALFNSIYPADVITNLDGHCPVNDTSEWLSCLGVLKVSRFTCSDAIWNEGRISGTNVL